MPQLVDRFVDELLEKYAARERRGNVFYAAHHEFGMTWGEVERRLIALAPQLRRIERNTWPS